MEISIKFDTVKNGPLYILRGHRLLFKKDTVFRSLHIQGILPSIGVIKERMHIFE